MWADDNAKEKRLGVDQRTVYTNVSRKGLILRDRLAAERTALAAERTFLAYMRTAVSLLAAGASFIRFFGVFTLTLVGWVFVISAPAVIFLGVWRLRQSRRHLRKIRIEADKC